MWDTTETGECERELLLPAGPVTLGANMAIPPGARMVVVFAHGSGSGRHSPRNRHVAALLRSAGLATLLADLLTSEEERDERITGRHRFDIDLLATRLVEILAWVCGNQEMADLGIGLFGSSTGAAAALIAAAELSDTVEAVVSRGGRTDLAGPALARVRAPTLFIVGERDEQVVELNRKSLELLGGVERRLEIVPGATHLFEEPGALDQVARLAADWFVRHGGQRQGAPAGRCQERRR